MKSNILQHNLTNQFLLFYQDHKAVYSIWVAISEDEKNTAVEFSIKPTELVWHLADHGRYDLMTVVIVNI